MASPNGIRNPKELKKMVSESHQDINDMKTNLAKLRGLSEDEKTENALLRSRIDEQSQLIMILKRRSDEATTTAKTLERVNSELIEFRENAVLGLEAQMRKYNLLDERFMQLASNHEAMIQIKDEYKLQNAALRAENLRLQEANKHQFSPVIEQQNATIAALETLLDSTTKEKQEAESRCRELDELLNQEKDVHKREVDELREKLSLTEKQLSDKVSHLETELRNQRSADSTTKTHLEAVTKEKDELLDVIMRRGKLIQDKQTDIKHLQQKVETTERAMREMQEKFEEDSEMVDRDARVRRLKKELEQLQRTHDESLREFEAYKKHSNELLQKEKELNDRLRHLVAM